VAGVSAIDPRLRQRRIAVRRAEGRRRLRVVMTVILVLLAGTGAYAATQSPLLDLDTVDVSGAFGSEAEAVRDAAGLVPGTPMIELDLDTAVEAVVGLPWVAGATIDRNWPGSVAIDVERRIAVAVLPTGDGGSVLIDAEAVAIEQVSVAPATLPVIAVVAAGELGDVQTQVLPLLPLVEVIPDDLRPWIETLGIRNDGGAGGLEINLVGSAVADLGDGRFLPEKLEALRSMLTFADRRCVVEYDLRVADIVNVRRDEACEVARTAADEAAEASAGDG